MRMLTGLFLGAGATCEVGMPLVWDLTDELRRWLTPDKLRSFNDAWLIRGNGRRAETIEHLVRLLENRDLHYEAILGSLETEYRRLGATNAVRQDFHAMYAWLIQMIYHLFYARHVKNEAVFQRTLSTLDGIADLAEKNAPLWVFTLNHDLVIECFATTRGINVNCGYTSEVITLPRRDSCGREIGRLRAETISAADLENGIRPFIPYKQKGINLLKVHGGLDQFTFRDGKDLLRVLPEEQSIAGVLESLRAVNEDLVYIESGKQVACTNEIAYADDSGEMQFLRRSLLSGAYKFDPHRDQVLPKRILDHFRNSLNQVARLVCIGYGLGDDHINKIIRAWLETTTERHIEIVDPYIKAIPAWLLHIAAQVTIVKSTGSDYLDQVAGITRTRAEKLGKRLTAYSRVRPKEQAQRELAAFMKTRRESSLKTIAEKLRDLPLGEDGNLDASNLGISPEEFARKLAGEHFDMDDLLEAFLASRESASLP